MVLAGTKHNGFYTYDTREVFAVARTFAKMHEVSLQEAVEDMMIANEFVCTPMGVVVELIGDTTLEVATRELLWNG